MSYSCIIIGLGRIGLGYDLDLHGFDHILTHAKAFSLHNGFDLKGGVDTNPGNCSDFERVYRRPAFQKTDDALNSLKPEIVVISVPTELHFRVISGILRSGGHKPKVLLCEKPLSYSLVEAMLITNLCKKHHVKLFVNYIRRSDPGAIEIKKRIMNGLIIEPLKAHVWYSKGILNNGSHFVNLLNYWFGEFENGMIINPGRTLENGDLEPDAFMKFKNGTAIFSSCREEAFSHYTIEIVSPSGRLYYGNGGEAIKWYAASIDILNGIASIDSMGESIEDGMKKYQWNVTDQLCRHLDGKSSSLSDSDDAIATLSAIHHTIS